MEWKMRKSDIRSPLYGITYGNGNFIAVSDEILSSPDGITWEQRESGRSFPLRGVSYHDGTFVAVGSELLTSINGVTWTRRNVGHNDELYGVNYANGAFFAVGAYGTIIQSGAVTPSIAPPKFRTESLTKPMDGMMHLSVEAQQGARLQIEVSTNLMRWTTLTNQTTSSGRAEITDPSAGDFGMRFYRARQILQ